MPYYVEKGCEGKADWWAVVDAAGDAFGCHSTKQAAIDQAVAISLSDDEPFEGERNLNGSRVAIADIDGTLISGGRLVERVYRFVKSQDARMFIVTGRPESQRVETERELANLGVSYSRLVMNDGSTADSPEYKKRVAVELLKTFNVVVAVDNDELTRGIYDGLGIDAVNPSDIGDNRNMNVRAAVGELAVDDFVRWIVGEDDVWFGRVVAVDGERAEVVALEDEDGAWVEKGLTVIVAVAELSVVEQPEPEVEDMPEDAPTDQVAPDEGMRADKREREQRTNHMAIEVREGADGMTFEGYAAVFNSASEPLPFIEKIERGAFQRSLKSRNDIKLLWNHDTSHVLGSTRAKTLTLVEDDRGLKVRGILPNTSAGRDAAELLKRGDVDSMSFGFTVIKDTWNSDGTERTLKAVRLHEVSIVAFPAYSGTAGTTSVRNLDKLAERANVPADALSAALMKVEAGEDITADDRNLLTKVIDELHPVDDKPQGDFDLLALKKKKLQLIKGL